MVGRLGLVLLLASWPDCGARSAAQSELPAAPAASSSAPSASALPASSDVGEKMSRVLITDLSQREAAVGREVTVVGVQRRSKPPEVCGIEVDGDYDLSDRRVTAQGVLRRLE